MRSRLWSYQSVQNVVLDVTYKGKAATWMFPHEPTLAEVAAKYRELAKRLRTVGQG